MKKTFKWLFILIVVSVSLCYMGNQVHREWDAIRRFDWSLNKTKLLISFLILLLYFCVTPIGWMIILRKFGGNVSLVNSFRILYLSQLAKYIPGGVWSYLSQMYLGRSEYLKKRDVLTSSLFSVYFNVIAGGILYLVSQIKIIWLICGAAFLIILFMAARNLYFKKLTGIGGNFTHISLLASLRITALYFGFWLVFGWAFWFLIDSISSVRVSEYLLASGSFSIAWVIGFVSLVVPAGIGVREGALVYFLGYFLPSPDAIIISLVSRIWVTIAELMCIGVAAILTYLRS